MSTPTKKQKEILDFINSYINKHGISPTIEEIARNFKRAVGTIHEHIEELAEKGFIKKDNSVRSIEIIENEELVKIPLKGFVAAGTPIEIIEKYETITIPKSLLAKSGEHFALRVKGNSMIQEGIFDGDNVIIRKQNTAENGETIVALINGNEATLKKIYKVAGGFKLQPANPTIPAIIVKQIIVQGKVISVMRNYETRRILNEPLNLFAFNEDLKHLIVKTQEDIKNEFKPNSEFEIWQKTEEKPDHDKFCLETTYTLLNELLLLWVCKDKQLIKFEAIENRQKLTTLKKDAQEIYSHIFINNIFGWYNPSDILLLEITNIFNKYDFSRIDRDILGKMYEQFITKEERKRLGQFYTPEAIIDYILDQTGYANNIEDKKIIDISCGSGGFLTRATNRLINKLKKNADKEAVINKIIDNIYGLDINPFACYLAETNILLQLLDLIIEAKQNNQKYKVPKIKIFQTNTIETPFLLSADEQEIKDIKNKSNKFASGFDCIVGNPPYLEAKKMDKKTKELCAETCPRIAAGAFDLFVCFIDKGLRLLKNGGKFGYIFPNKFLIANYAKKMRDELLCKYSIKEIIDVSECDVFENVSVYPVIFIVENKKPQNNLIKTAEKINNTKELENKNFIINEIKQDIYKRDDFVFFILPSDKKQNSLLMKLLSDQYKTLDNYLTIKWTISFHALGLREKFLFSEKPNSENAKKLIGGKSFAGNDDINRYKLKWGGWWIDYNEDLARKHKNQLPPRSLFEQKKLIICQNSLRLRASYDEKDFYCKDTFFVAHLNQNAQKNYNLKFFLALLNSKLLHYYYANIYKGTHVAGGYLHYLIGYLYSLPVAEPTKKQQLEIVALADKILFTKEEKEFARIDENIDKLIYSLYNLNDQEIKTVNSFI
ncbi:MAG: methyltransferase BseMII protein [Parcubacteria group bacterium GW2011_GWA2_38_13]|nr:MAG: methyltransferase BseMII protein [Parcubacteria group bacterium GW2011_GWA2_38_13]